MAIIKHFGDVLLQPMMGTSVAALIITLLYLRSVSPTPNGTDSDADICQRLCPNSQNCQDSMCPQPICYPPVIPPCPECPSPCPNSSSGLSPLYPQSCPEPVCPAPNCPAPRCPTPICPEPQCPELRCPPSPKIPACPAVSCPEPVCPEPRCPTPICPRSPCPPTECPSQPENVPCPTSGSGASCPLPICPQPVCPTPICPEPRCPDCPKLPTIPPCPTCPSTTCPQGNSPSCPRQSSSSIGGAPGCKTCLWKVLVTYDHFPGIGFYKAYKHKLTWHQANISCTGDGGHLAVINSQKEADVLKLVFQKYELGGWIHIGFHDLYEEGRYETVLGTPLSESGYVRWHPGKPDNWGRNEHCGTIENQALLNDGNCDWKVGFICEAPESKVLGI